MIRKTLIVAAAAMMAVGAFATDDEVKLETLQQKASYAMGADMAGGLKMRDIEIDPALFVKGFMDISEGRESLIGEDEFRQVMTDFHRQVQEKMQAKRMEMADKNQKEGDEFLAANKEKEGVKVTDSGLQYLVIEEGEGDSPMTSDTVTVPSSSVPV